MVTRKAILIGNNTGYNAPTFLRGVDKDLVNYHNYLTSDVGGQWNGTEEIKILHNKGRTEIIREIEKCFAYYSFVVFSGHGYINSYDGLTYICVNGGIICESELSTHLRKQTLILDCCREVTSLSKSFTGDILSEGGEVISGTKRRIINARDKFDNALASSSDGLFTGYACLVDQLSGDNPSAGGVFSSTLIRIGSRFGNLSPEKGWWLPVKETVEIVKKELESNFTDQVPDWKITKPMNLTHPFAVTNQQLKNLW